MDQQVKSLPAMQETQERWFGGLVWKDLLEEEMATHSSLLALKNPMDKGAWQAIVQSVARSRTQLSD